MLLEKMEESIKAQIIATRWLGYLLQYMDHKNLEKLLYYYEDIGWISTHVRERLMALSRGIKSTGRGEWMLPSRVHLTSLLFISHLAGRDLRDLRGIGAYIRMFIEEPEDFTVV